MHSNAHNSQKLLETVIQATQEAASTVKGTVWSDEYYQNTAARHYRGADAHHVAIGLDGLAHNVVLRVIGASFPSSFVISEEDPPSSETTEHNKEDICFIADPLDGSAFAAKCIPLASSSLCAYSLSEQRPIASAVTDVFLGVTYFTAEHLDGAWCIQDQKRLRLRPSSCERLDQAACSALATQPVRFAALAAQTDLIQNVAWLLNSGGAIDICRVAAGDLDATIEFAKGFRIWDIAAGAHILSKARGCFGQLKDGKPILLMPSRQQRFPFIAAATPALFEQLQRILKGSRTIV